MSINRKINKTDNRLRIYSTLSRSYANGPGERAVIWLQGCSLRCNGCFNPDFWDYDRRREVEYTDLFTWLSTLEGISGITISGGEPTGQISALIPFLHKIRIKTALSIILFSGRILGDIGSLQGGEKLISLLDVLIDGRYEADCANPPGIWPSSYNQKIHFITDRYSKRDFHALPVQEVMINKKGEIVETGILVSGQG